MNKWKEIVGVTTVILTSGDPAGALEGLIAQGVRLYRVEWMDDLTVGFVCPRREEGKVRTLAKKRGDRIRISGRTGILQTGKQIAGRPILAAAILSLFALTLWLPTRVLFFQVEGNGRVPARLILETAADCGIRFGASRRQVRSEKMKNALLGAMPELKWAGINTSGCVATIFVRERALEDRQESSTGVADIAACRDAYVTDITVTRGNPLCVTGQVVQEGDILISGVTDLGLCIQVTQAQGEVFGQTEREMTLLTPVWREQRMEEGKTHHSLWLILGKKRINFWKDSGISTPTCGRMYKEYYMTLPGGFQLPVRLGVETVTQWETAAVRISEEELTAPMESFARDRLAAQMVAGQILQEETALFTDEDGYLMESRFLCSEMIGRVAKGETNGKTD